MSLLKHFFLGFLLAIPAVIQASDLPQWEIIPAESEISFTATQNDAPFSGSFKKFK